MGYEHFITAVLRDDQVVFEKSLDSCTGCVEASGIPIFRGIFNRAKK